MSGHSKFANIKHRKSAQDEKRSKVFTKLQREIMVAAKYGGTDPHSNPRLRAALISAKRYNMPNSKITNAINSSQKITSGQDYENIKYEGYGISGVAILVDALTNNKNRTASEVRSAFTKCGGNLGESGSVQRLFHYVGIIIYNHSETCNEILEIAINNGASDIIETNDLYIIESNPKDFLSLSGTLEEQFGSPVHAEKEWVATTKIALSKEKYEKIEKLVELLEDSDDVQSVYSNHELEE